MIEGTPTKRSRCYTVPCSCTPTAHWHMQSRPGIRSCWGHAPHCRQASVLPMQALSALSKSQKKKAKAKAAAARKQAAAEAGDCNVEQDGSDRVGSEGPWSSTAAAGGACL